MLLAISPAYADKRHGMLWNCKCDCGKDVLVYASDIKAQRLKSCGCMRYKLVAQSKKKYNQYIFVKDFVIGYTAKNEPFLVDASDYERIKNISWHSDGKGYICGFYEGKQVFLHRFIMNVLDNGIIIDHINHCGLDNRKHNLRYATAAQNSYNKDIHSQSVSGRRGVYWDKSRNKWRAYIIFNRKYVNIGRYDSLDSAIEARVKAEKTYFKGFSASNTLAFDGVIEEDEK
jgi:hypothetical protein